MQSHDLVIHVMPRCKAPCIGPHDNLGERLARTFPMGAHREVFHDCMDAYHGMNFIF